MTVDARCKRRRTRVDSMQFFPSSLIRCFSSPLRLHNKSRGKVTNCDSALVFIPFYCKRSSEAFLFLARLQRQREPSCPTGSSQIDTSERARQFFRHKSGLIRLRKGLSNHATKADVPAAAQFRLLTTAEFHFFDIRCEKINLKRWSLSIWYLIFYFFCVFTRLPCRNH